MKTISPFPGRAIGSSPMFLTGCLLVASLLCSNCLYANEVSDKEDEIVELGYKVQDYKEDIKKLEEDVKELEARAKEVAGQVESVEALIQSKKDTKENIGVLETKLQEKAALLQAYKEAFVIRTPIKPGGEYPQLAMKSGSTLTNAKLLEVDGTKLKFSHSAGIGYYDATDLPDEMQKGFVLPPSDEGQEVVVADILAAKPESLMSKEAVEAMKAEASKIARMESTQKKIDAREERAQKRAAYMEKRQKELNELAANKEKRTEIYREVDKLRKRQYEIQRQRQAQMDEWAKASIKPAASVRQSTIDQYDAQISQVEKAIEELKAKANGL